MPIRYVIDKTQRLVFSTGWDRVTAAEILAHRGQLTADPDFDPTFNQLVDGRAVTAVDISIADVKDIASRRCPQPVAPAKWGRQVVRIRSSLPTEPS